MFTLCHETDAEGVADDGGPWAIFNRLRLSHEELSELDTGLKDGWTITFMLRAGEWREADRTILGKCYLMGSSNKDLRPLFEQLLEDTIGFYPTFIIVLSADWWESASLLERETLLFHELLHPCQAKDKHGEPAFNNETGEPKPAIRSHDLEEFDAVVRRYGAWSEDIRKFLLAAGRG